MSARTVILNRLRRGVANPKAPTRKPEDLPSPAKPADSIHGSTAERLARFAELAEATQMTSDRVDSVAAVAEAVRTYLAQNELPPEAVIDTTLPVPAEAWRAAGVSPRFGEVAPDGDVYVSAGLAAIAECGAVVIASGAGRALRRDFLARTHIVVVPAGRLLASFAGLWDIVRSDAVAGRPAREYCLITGPSRTADLGVPAKLGAHGPARVHVLLIGTDE